MSENLRSRREDDPVLRQATEWALELADPATSLERVGEWQGWLSMSVRHREAFSQIEELMAATDHIRVVPWPSEADLTADEYDAKVDVSTWKSAGSLRRPGEADAMREQHGSHRFGFLGRRVFLSSALAATVLLGVAMLLAGYPRTLSVPGVLVYKKIETPSGGTLKVTLADGSTVEVGGRSSLRTVITRQTRHLTLEEGEAFFRVAKDTKRPFVVGAGSTSILAVGTAFNVRRSGKRVVVSVAEGTVKVDAPHGSRMAETTNVSAGQQLSIEPQSESPAMATIDTAAVASWRDGRLQYINEPLSSVVIDVERHTGRRIKIATPAIGELRITGTVLEHNLTGWLTSLEETLPVRTVQHGDGTIGIEAR